MSKINVKILTLNCNHWAYFSKELNDLNSGAQSDQLSLWNQTHLVSELMNNLILKNQNVLSNFMSKYFTFSVLMVDNI